MQDVNDRFKYDSDVRGDVKLCMEGVNLDW